MNENEHIEKVLRDTLAPSVVEGTHRDNLKSQLIEEMQKENILMSILRSSYTGKTKWATVAIVVAIIAVVIGINPWGGGPTLAFADVIEQIQNFRPYTCVETVQQKGRPAYTCGLMRLSLTQRREVRPDGTITVFDLSQMKSLTLLPKKKLAVEKTYIDRKSAKDPDILQMLCGMKNGIAEDLGMKEIDGRTVQGFRKTDEYNDITIWADIETRLPIRAEFLHVKTGQTIVMSDYNFDVDFDESLFSTTAPEGYTVEKIDVPKHGKTTSGVAESDEI